MGKKKKTYEVTITETWRKTVYVEATSYEDAEEIVGEGFANGDEYDATNYGELEDRRLDVEECDD